MSTSRTVGGLKKKKSAANFHLAAEDAIQQLHLEGVRSTHQDDEEAERLLSTHRSTLQDSFNKAKKADVVRSREETELHKTVESLMKETEELRHKLRDETVARLAAEDKEHKTKLSQIELDEELATAQAKIAQLQVLLQNLQKENAELHSDLSASRLQLSIQTLVKKKSSKALAKTSTNENGEGSSPATPAASGTVSASAAKTMSSTLTRITTKTLTDTQGYEKRLRDSLLAREEDVRRLMMEYSVYHRRGAETLRDLAVVRIERARQAQTIDQLKSKIQTLEVAAAHQHHHHDHHAESKSEYSVRTGASSQSRRSISPRLASQTNHPWYPPGKGANYHLAPRSKSPRSTLSLPLREKSPSPGPSSSPPRPTPRRNLQSTPIGSGAGVQTTPRPRAGTFTPTPLSGSRRPSPSRESVSRTLEHLAGLMEELRTWQEEPSP
jgi:hypothetical protein